MYRSPDQNYVLKIYHLCFLFLCTAPVCLCLISTPVCLLISCLYVDLTLDLNLERAHYYSCTIKSWSYVSVHFSLPFIYVHQKREAVCTLHLPVTGQGSTPLSLIPLSILYVLLRTLFVTSRPSCLACKGEEHRFQKKQTPTTTTDYICHQFLQYFILY